MSIIVENITYTKDFLVKRAYEILSKLEKKKNKFIEPNIVIKDKKTYITNFEEFCNSINRDKNIVKMYIDKETNIQSSFIGDFNQLKIDSLLRQPHLKNIITIFIKLYILCQECKSSNTNIIKKNRSSFTYCNMCKSERIFNI
jgi:translation initiation factor 2 subunit 2